jgi:DNA primase
VTFSLRARRYFANHAISPRVAWDCGVREGTGGLLWPTVDAHGQSAPRLRRWGDVKPKVVGIKGRTLGVWWPLGSPVEPHDVLVCEGESDALAAVSALAGDARVCVASLPGASFPARRLATELQRVGASVVALGFDGDLAGGAATERIALNLATHGIGSRVLAVPFDNDLAGVLAAEPNPGRWLRKALLAAEPRHLEMAALIAENRWLRERCLDLQSRIPNAA